MSDIVTGGDAVALRAAGLMTTVRLNGQDVTALCLRASESEGWVEFAPVPRRRTGSGRLYTYRLGGLVEIGYAIAPSSSPRRR